MKDKSEEIVVVVEGGVVECFLRCVVCVCDDIETKLQLPRQHFHHYIHLLPLID